MNDKHEELRNRTKAFALRVIRMSQALPRSREANVITQQVLRSATGMAANYRAAGRSRTKPEFIAKLGVVIEEADESVFWLEMLGDSGIFDQRSSRRCKMRQSSFWQYLPHPAELPGDEASSNY